MDGKSDAASKQGLQIDTQSNLSKQMTMSKNSNLGDSPQVRGSPRNNLGGIRRGDESPSKSQINDNDIPTPRNLQGRNQPGSGTLPGQKRSMDGVVTPH